MTFLLRKSYIFAKLCLVSKNIKFYRYFLLMLECFLIYPTIAQPPINPRFERISIEKGLPGKRVNSITQDNKGFIWLGTSNGLSRYDGYSLKNYQFDPKDSSIIYFIESLWVDKKNRLWIGTEANGLKYLDLKSGVFSHFEHDPKDPKSLSGNAVWAICEDTQNNIWFGIYGGGLDKWNEEERNFSHYQYDSNDSSSLSNNGITCLYEDSQGRFWIGTDVGLNLFNREQESFRRFYIDQEEVVPARQNSITAIFEDKRKQLWIGTYGNIYLFNNGKFTLIAHDFYPSTTSGMIDFSSIGQDRREGLWIGTNGQGLNFLDFTSKKYHVYKNDPSDPFSLSNNTINYTALYTDRENNLWIGTRLGVNKYHQGFQHFKAYEHDPEIRNSLSENHVLAVHQDQQ